MPVEVFQEAKLGKRLIHVLLYSNNHSNWIKTLPLLRGPCPCHHVGWGTGHHLISRRTVAQYKQKVHGSSWTPFAKETDQTLLLPHIIYNRGGQKVEQILLVDLWVICSRFTKISDSQWFDNSNKWKRAPTQILLLKLRMLRKRNPVWVCGWQKCKLCSVTENKFPGLSIAQSYPFLKSKCMPAPWTTMLH